MEFGRALTRLLNIEVSDFDSLALLEVSRHSGFIRGALASEGSRERGRGQGRGHHRDTGKGQWRSQARGRTVKCFYCNQEGHIKRDCPKFKAHDQSSDTAATAVMAVDESDHASDIYGWQTTRLAELLAEGQSGSAWQMGDSKGCSFDASGGTLRVSKENKEMLWGKKTGGLYRLEGNVQTGGATVRHRSNGISEKNGQGKQPLHRGYAKQAQGYLEDPEWYKSAGRCFGISKGAVTPKRVSFALDLISGGVLSSCAHKGGDMEPRQLAKHFGGKWSSPLMRLGISDAVLQSYGGAGSEAVRKDNLKTSDYPPIRLMIRYSVRSQPPPSLGLSKGMVGCLDFLRALCCGLRTDCCEVRLRGKTERDGERGRELSDRVSSVVIHSFDSGLVISLRGRDAEFWAELSIAFRKAQSLEFGEDRYASPPMSEVVGDSNRIRKVERGDDDEVKRLVG
ncbi:hypothetical protein Acr_15g0008640 [Actinidia rufa]|uniref:CCHC-type domain-containing protein n=1 Tax=Actinidia rufa TaxID=165716 RepID=A0A7J0FU78_9ERIC|nr:hypothetical protein Acr_15g0008640 [Actinidia rufa]